MKLTSIELKIRNNRVEIETNSHIWIFADAVYILWGIN